MEDLGTGEVLAAEKGTIRIRFASGERNFLWAKVEEHLAVTQEAPPPPVKVGKARAPRASKAKAPKAAKAAKPAAALDE
jgi:hypothetical protein